MKLGNAAHDMPNDAHDDRSLETAPGDISNR